MSGSGSLPWDEGGPVVSGDADVLSKRRQSTGKEVHYFLGPIRETLEEAEGDRRRWETSPFDKIAADKLADEVAALVVNRHLDSRSAAADALLDYREPPRTERSDRIAALESEKEALRGERARLREKVEAMRETVSGHLHAAFQSGKTASTLYWKETGREEAFREVLTLLAEPGEEAERECCGCHWSGPESATVHPKHDDSARLCPDCHEVTEPKEPRT